MSRLKLIFLLSLSLFILLPVTAEETNKPKYVFYFIGDGLGSAQRQLAEYYLKQYSGEEKLRINSFPVAGIITTYSNNTLVTDSAAAGTALATGHKTNNSIIGISYKLRKVRNLTEAAQEEGWLTGIVTTTRLTHATPACFSAHNINRNAEKSIAKDIYESNVDFLAGGGSEYFAPSNWKDGKSKRIGLTDYFKKFTEKGYSVFAGNDAGSKFIEYKPAPGEKIFAALNYSHMPYEIDRVNKDLKLPSLAQMVSKGISCFENSGKNFFMMIEGGRIDHACHANDPVAMIHDTIAFDKAVNEAFKFYMRHPEETLIVVAADHETGGNGLGFGTNYFINLEPAQLATISIADTLNSEYPYTENADRDKYLKILERKLGLSNLSTKEKKQLQKAMNLVDKGSKGKPVEYGKNNPVSVTVVHILSERMNIQWTTFAHTGTQIPLSAIGCGSQVFSGFYDNTDIPKKIAELADFKLDN